MLFRSLRWEKSRDDALFPHLYGPLELDAVDRVSRLPDDRDAADAIADVLGQLPAQPGLLTRGCKGRVQSAGMIRQLAVAVATSLPAPSTISARENATRRPGLTTVPTARRVPLSPVTGRV